MPSVPWLYVLEKLWHDDQGEKVVHDKCLLASKVSLVCKEWAGHVRAGQMGNSFEQEIAKSLYSDILEDGRGIPRIKVQDSLKKEIEIELCRRSSRIPVEHFVMSDFISLISTAGSIAAFAHVIPKPSELVLGVNCWRGSIGAYVNHSLSIYCLKKATVVNQFPSNNRINALHVSVSNEIFAADQDGYVKVYSSVDSEAPWSETTTRVWRHPAQEAISCMSIREGNEHKVAVATCSGIHILISKEGSLQGLQSISFQKKACDAKHVFFISEISASIAFSNGSTVHYVDENFHCAWSFSHDQAVSYQEKDVRTLSFIIPVQSRQKAIPLGILRLKGNNLSLILYEDETVAWNIPMFEALCSFHGDEVFLYLVFEKCIKVASIRDPRIVLLRTRRPTRNADYFISTSLDTVGLFEDVSLRQLAGGGMGQLFHMGLTFVESARLACSGNVLICAELVENNIPMRVWYLHGSRTSKWPAVTRALCKSALYQLLIRDKGVQISTKDRPYREEAAHDYLSLLLATAAYNQADLQEHGSFSASSSERTNQPHLESQTAGEGEELSFEQLKLEEAQVKVLQVRRDCGQAEGRRWFKSLELLAGDITTPIERHMTQGFWISNFMISPEAADDLAAAAAECRDNECLLRLPEMRNQLHRHITLSHRPARLLRLFSDMVGDSLPHRREDTEDIGRGQGREAAVHEWKRRWLSNARALFEEGDSIHALLQKELDHYH